MKIINKFRIATITPSLILLGATLYLMYQAYIGYISGNSLKIASQNSVELNKLMVEIGKERGLSSLYLSSNMDNIQEALIKQRGIDISLMLVVPDLLLKGVKVMLLLL